MKVIFLTILSLISVGLSSGSAQAESLKVEKAQSEEFKNFDPQYFQLGKIQIQELSLEQMDPRLFQGGLGASACSNGSARFLSGGDGGWINATTGEVAAVDMIVDQIINIGKKIWAVVEQGRPVTTVRADVATALPAGAKCWQDLQTWSMPVSRTWGITFENLYGIEVIRLVYRVIYLPGGSIDGVGSYIGYATVEPVEINVAWGYTFNVQASVPTVFNMGTKLAPVAGMNIQVKWSVDTVMKHVEQSQSFFIDGRGTFKQLQ